MLVAAAAAAAALRAVYYNNSTRFNDITAADGAAAVVVAYTHANYICVMCLCGRRVCVHVGCVGAPSKRSYVQYPT